jgi:hypothetical protein
VKLLRPTHPSTNTAMVRLRGRCPRGIRLTDHVPLGGIGRRSPSSLACLRKLPDDVLYFNTHENLPRVWLALMRFSHEASKRLHAAVPTWR